MSSFIDLLVFPSHMEREFTSEEKVNLTCSSGIASFPTCEKPLPSTFVRIFI